MNELITKIKLRPGMEDASDELLEDLIADAIADVLNFIHYDTIPKGLEGAIKNIVLIQYNRMGDEGLSSVNRGSTNQSYLDGLPKAIINQLNSYRKVPKSR